MRKRRLIEVVAVLVLVPTTFLVFKYVPRIFDFFVALALNLGVAAVLLERGGQGV